MVGNSGHFFFWNFIFQIAEAEFEEDAALDGIEDVILDNENDSEDESDNSEVNIALIAQIAHDNVESWKVKNMVSLTINIFITISR